MRRRCPPRWVGRGGAWCPQPPALGEFRAVVVHGGAMEAGNLEVIFDRVGHFGR